MEVTHGGQTVDLNITDHVIINLSGGTDSAALLFLICTHFPNIGDIKIATFRDLEKPGDVPRAIAIREWMQKRFPNIDMSDHIILDFDEGDPYWIAEAQRKIDDPNIETFGFTRAKGLAKLMQTRRLNMKVMEDNPGYMNFTAVTANPPVEYMVEHGFRHLSETRRDKGSEALSKYPPNQLLAKADKKFVAGVFEDYGLMEDLFPLTNSCIDIHVQPCKRCFWCHEKYWAFGTY